MSTIVVGYPAFRLHCTKTTVHHGLNLTIQTVFDSIGKSNDTTETDQNFISYPRAPRLHTDAANPPFAICEKPPLALRKSHAQQTGTGSRNVDLGCFLRTSVLGDRLGECNGPRGSRE
ncbi:general stress protein [Anopheles sinensis]|uniref:General stress protein n=1 Tax=Anopheles sinensis TaxID=74873 RepID=A0A084W9K1_ANOSI|nr:general stress protein [Anopheles sinensis]